MKYNNFSIDDDEFLKLIFRLCIKSDSYTRISDLSCALGIQPSSINYFINKLYIRGYITKKEFGVIKLTTNGRRRCEFLYNN